MESPTTRFVSGAMRGCGDEHEQWPDALTLSVTADRTGIDCCRPDCVFSPGPRSYKYDEATDRFVPSAYGPRRVDMRDNSEWLRVAAIVISPLCILLYILLFVPALLWQAARVNLWAAFGWRLPPEGDPLDEVT